MSALNDIWKQYIKPLIVGILTIAGMLVLIIVVSILMSDVSVIEFFKIIFYVISKQTLQ